MSTIKRNQGERCPKFDGVDEGDSMLVYDVLCTLEKFGLFKTYAINSQPTGYEILTWFSRPEGQDMCVSFKELQCLQHLNPARVKDYGIKIQSSNNTVCIRVLLLSHKEPAMIEELVSVYKRKRWDRKD